MSPPERSFRLFDAKKYEEIEPVIKAIHGKTASNEQVTALINEALAIVETDDFKKNNFNKEWSATSPRTLQEALILIEYLGVLAWPGELIFYDPLSTIICVTCCPNYQEIGYSKFRVDYTESYGYVTEFTEELHDILSCPILLPSDSLDLGIYNSEMLAKITRMTAAIDPRVIIGVVDPRDRPELMKFYTDFDHLVKLANSQPNYTILYESQT
jgi:hypothetical protein